MADVLASNKLPQINMGDVSRRPLGSGAGGTSSLCPHSRRSIDSLEHEEDLKGLYIVRFLLIG